MRPFPKLWEIFGLAITARRRRADLTSQLVRATLSRTPAVRPPCTPGSRGTHCPRPGGLQGPGGRRPCCAILKIAVKQPRRPGPSRANAKEGTGRTSSQKMVPTSDEWVASEPDHGPCWVRDWMRMDTPRAIDASTFFSDTSWMGDPFPPPTHSMSTTEPQPEAAQHRRRRGRLVLSPVPRRGGDPSQYLGRSCQ